MEVSTVFDPTDFAQYAESASPATVADEKRGEYLSAVSDLEQAARDAGAGELASSGAIGRMAQARCRMLSTVIRATGSPDWGMASDLAKNVIRAIEDRGFNAIGSDLTDAMRKKIVDAVKKQVGRKYRRPQVILYVLDTVNGLSSHREKVYPGGTFDPAALAAMDTKPPIAVRRAVEAEYAAAKGITTKAWPDEVNTGGALSAGDQGQASVKTKALAVEKAAEGGPGGVVPAVALAHCLAALKATVRGALPLGEIEDRETMIENAREIEGIAGLFGLWLDNDTDAAGTETLTKAVAKSDATTTDDDDDDDDDDDEAKADEAAIAAEKKAEAKKVEAVK